MIAGLPTLPGMPALTGGGSLAPSLVQRGVSPAAGPSPFAENRDRQSTAATVRLPDIENADELVTALKEMHSASSIYKARLYQEAYLGRAFYLGHHYVGVDPLSLNLLQGNPANEIREVVNKTQTRVNEALALLAGTRPKLIPIPATRQTKDRQFAALSQDMLDYCDRVTANEDLRTESDALRIMDGTCALRYWIDPNGGEQLTTNLPGQTPQFITHPEIRADIYSLAHFHIFPLTAPSPRQVRAVMYDAWTPIEEVRDKFPQLADKIAEDPDTTAFESALQNIELLFGPTSAYGSRMRPLKGQTRVFEYLELPSAKYPRGRWLTWCNETLLDTQVNPFVGLFPPESAPALQLGCVFVRGITVPGRFWGIGMPEAGRPAQIRLNRLKTDQTANRRAMGMNRIITQKGTIAHPSQLTNVHGAVIEINPDATSQMRPTILPATALPGIDLEIQRASDDLDDAFMRPAISRGVNEAQVRSEAHARLLLNNANNPFSLLAKERARADRDGAIIKLALVRGFFPPLKILRIVGEQKGYVLPLLQQQHIYADVEIVAGTEMPKDPDSWNNTLIGIYRETRDQLDPRRRRWFLDNFDLGGRRYEDPERVHVDRAQTENAGFERGQFSRPQPWEAHILHVEQHEYFLAENPQLPPQIQQMVMAHVMLHRQAIVATMMPPAGLPVPGAGAPQLPARPAATANRPPSATANRQLSPAN